MKVFRQIVLREWRLLSKEAAMAVLLLTGPLAFALVVGAVYSPKKLTGLAVTIVDQDSSALSRDLIRSLLATEPFVLGQYAESPWQFRYLSAAGQSHICFVFPRNFERDIKAGKGAKVAVLVDASNLLAANIAVTAASTVLASYSIGAEIQSLERRGMPPAQAARTATPLLQQTRSLFNPAFNSNYANFIVLGLIAVPIQLVCLLAASRAGGREFGGGSAELRELSRNLVIMVVGKSAAYVAILWPACWLAMHVPQWWLGFPAKGSEWLLAVVTLWFVTNMVMLGIAISTFSKDALLASEVCAVITMPNFLVSGFTWPVFAMPAGLAAAAYLLPMNPFVFAVRKITLMGAGANDLTRELLLLAGWSAVAGMLALAGTYGLQGDREPGKAHP
jgi:ABC-2 type transport system permease protein